MAAVIADAETVRNIHWILGSILTDSVIDTLGILLHLLGVDKVLDSELANNSLRTCKVYIYSSWFPRKSRRSADGYLLLYHYLCNGEMEELTSACKEERKLLHRHSCFLWIVAIALTVPIVVDDLIKMTFPWKHWTTFHIQHKNIAFISSGTMSFISYSIFPLLFTWLFLVITVCVIKGKPSYKAKLQRRLYSNLDSYL